MNTHHVTLRQSTEGIDRENLFIIVDKVRSEGRVEFFRASSFFFSPKTGGSEKNWITLRKGVQELVVIWGYSVALVWLV
jgi:hypothetical protein